ncbi:FUSC family protein [Dictyobacter arantiisoli]|uniref:TIGR01666 family membrane protein n=1 Tax=Dictyobacter arantiisoli TaxID=2014874 RepID=A0A5A5TEN6_9CHLR|nr:FUSC family protein [Dictyobacter arantiisoli]GCF10031.1 TIGR01666 family membrane protein [Dictyobacter arantiisoli]
MQDAVRSLTSSVRYYMRTAFQLDKASITGGIRMTLITVLPIIVGAFLKRADLGVMVFMGGLYAILADVGGLYRTRAFAMGIATLGISLAAFVATLIGGSVWLAVPLMLLCAFGCGMLGVFGNVGSKVGFVVVGIFIIVMGSPASLLLAGERLGSFVLGGAWAMLLTLWLWPWQPLQPVQDALSAYYQAVSEFIGHSCRPDQGPRKSGVQWNQLVQSERAGVHAAQNTAHEVMLMFRSKREESSAQGRLFLLLTLSADRLFDAAIALAESTEVALSTIDSHTEKQEISALLNAPVQQIALILKRLAAQIERGTALHEMVWHEDLQRLDTLEEQLREALPHLLPDYAALARLRNVLRLLKHVRAEMETAFGYARRLYTGRSFESSQVQKGRSSWPWLHTLRSRVNERLSLLVDNLTPRSLIFRHALRLAVATTLAVACYIPLRIPNGYWIPLTILFILKPDYGGTRLRASQRVLGTMLGGLAATLLVATVHNEILVIALLFLIAFFTFAHLSGDYGIFVVFLTLFVVLMLDFSAHDGWGIALIRIANTGIGGLIAILFGYLFWPQWELERMPAQLARTITANREYFHCVMAVYLGETHAWDAVHQASRCAHLENANTSASFQRLLSEPKNKQGAVERFYALVTYNQHFSDRITALAQHIRTLDRQQQALPGLTAFVQQTEEILRDLEAAVSTGRHLSEVETLDQGLTHVQSVLKTLLEQCYSDFATRQQQQPDTSSQEAVNAASFVEAQLDRLTNDVIGMTQLPVS